MKIDLSKVLGRRLIITRFKKSGEKTLLIVHCKEERVNPSKLPSEVSQFFDIAYDEPLVSGTGGRYVFLSTNMTNLPEWFAEVEISSLDVEHMKAEVLKRFINDHQRNS